MSYAATVYPYITTNATILGGVPIIEGTRIAVRAIAGYYQMGMSVDEILTTLPPFKTFTGTFCPSVLF
ncbi:DUF433 domain-containing protein [Pseudanabaena sp. PCC 6802]|uniref:DUF433 domain-containing protein n=1 Tax=Pseudanabaena sp. PCC 6802 TaxID=118173 RepID=UPI0003495BDC|nr:DUF433 domain-containing protein [Pseudanabaena sp. PCC 6802]